MTTRTRRGTTDVPATRIVYYPDPTATTDPHAALVRHTVAELQARRRRDDVLYARWVQRQAVIAERDRRTRRALLWAFAGIGTTVIAVIVTACWLTYRAITTAATFDGSWLLGIALGAVVLSGIVAGGHKCITVIEHRH
ncbi:hypothetical protein AB0J82_12660 [Asanoa sp. NPDC049518]|uniref:hypothetical protein n=1 Tax=unclassified Asanoa TaxID=2685164 RepID=UPI0034258645